MTTANDIVRQSLLEIGVLAVGEGATAEEANDTLNVLNDMLAAWELSGIAIGAQSLALDTVVPWPQNHNRPIMLNLALRMAPQYGVSVNPITAQGASTGYRALQAAYGNPKDMILDRALRRNQWPTGRWFS
jgi:hypothetical protein